MRARWLKAFKRFAREKSGAAALEFAMVAIPFFLLTFGLAEVAMIGFTQTTLDYAVSETAREIRTGATQTNRATSGAVKQALCDELNGVMRLSCANLYLDVNTFASFTDARNNSPISNGTFNSSGFSFAPGAPSSIVVVRAYYRWKVLTPLFETLFQNVAGGERILSSTMMFRNEPFPPP